jgi:hypothetical protein
MSVGAVQGNVSQVNSAEVVQSGAAQAMARAAAAEPENVSQSNLQEASTPEVDLGGEAQKAEEISARLEKYLQAFYEGRITAGMLAANPALQLWVQQALQWENRCITLLSNLLRERHETCKAAINNLRA